LIGIVTPAVISWTSADSLRASAPEVTESFVKNPLER